MTKDNLGNLIKNLRIMKSMTQKDLAQKLHITDKAISKWETGASFPDITLLEPLAQIFNVPVSYFFTEDNPKMELSCIKKKLQLRFLLVPLFCVILFCIAYFFSHHLPYKLNLNNILPIPLLSIIAVDFFTSKMFSFKEE